MTEANLGGEKTKVSRASLSKDYRKTQFGFKEVLLVLGTLLLLGMAIASLLTLGVTASGSTPLSPAISI